MADIIMKCVVLIIVLGSLTAVCESCERGYYADTGKCLPCLENCIACSSASSCDSCRVGYFGISCSQVCPNHCHDNECNKTSGLCITCSKGYYSGDNKSCIKCPENCTACNSPQYCFACKKGYKGNACEDRCTSCRPGTSCDKQTGYCLESCRGGLSGDLCTTNCNDKCTLCERSNENECISCAHNRFGVSCNNICSQKCLNQTCRDSDGECIYAEMKENPPTQKGHSSNGITTVVIVFGILELIFVVVTGFGIVFRKRIGKYTACKWCHKTAGQLLSLYKSTHEVKNEEYDRQPLTTEMTEHAKISPKQQSEIEVDVEIVRGDKSMVVLQSEPRRRNLPGKTFENKVDDLMNHGNSLDTGGQFITRYACKLDYIVSVEPINSILKDVSAFLKILWVESCRKIVMLTSFLEMEDVYKFDQYLLCREKHNDFNIICNSGFNHDDYAVRTLTVKTGTGKTTDEREVSLFRYVDWPEKWDPENFLSLKEFFKLVNYVNTDLDGPTLVYSSAGVHRCATYIAADLLTKDGKEKSSDDVLACLQHMNRQRLHTNHEDTEFLTQMLFHSASSAKLQKGNETRAKLETNVVSFKNIDITGLCMHEKKCQNASYNHVLVDRDI